MSHNKRQLLETSLENEKTAHKETEVALQQASKALQNKNQELENVKLKTLKLVNEKQIELDNLFRTIIDPYILMDLKGYVIQMNNAAIDFFGTSLKKGSFNVKNNIYEKDMKHMVDAFHEFLKVGSLRNFQIRLFDKNKNLKWVDINCNIIFDINQKPKLAQGIIRDITSQKQQQEFFNMQKQQLDTIVENSSLGIVLIEDGKILKTNKTFRDLLNYEEGELSGLPFTHILIEEDRRKFNNHVKKLANKKAHSFSIIKRYKTKNAKIFKAKTKVSLVINTDNKDLKVIVIEDITKDFINQSLLMSLNRLMYSVLGKTDIQEIAKEIVTNTSRLLALENCAIQLIDPVTKELKKVANYPKEQECSVYNKIANDVIKKNNTLIINDVVNDKRYTKENITYGSIIFIPIIVKKHVIGLLYSKHSNKNFFSNHLSKTLTTITNLAAVKLESATNLKLLIETGNENKELVKNLRRSNKELDDFAHVVSHDLKSPLRNMNALTSWIQEKIEDTENDSIKENIQMLFNQIDKMDHLINGILKYARIDQVNSVNRKINIQNLVENLIKTLYIPEHVTVHINSKLPLIKMDKFRLHQLFQNLLSNAIKYCDKNNGFVTVGATEENTCWKFYIKDNGPGIPEKYHGKVFKIFKTLKDLNSSTGVGLSIVKKIIDMHDGKIWIDSVDQKGTTFYFTLPKPK